MSFPATEFELIVPPPFEVCGKTSTPRLYLMDDATTARLVRARLKSELPRESGLMPQKIASGVFGWLWWGLRDDYGAFLARRGGAK